MNFIFDVGNVLVDYKPLSYLESLFHDEVLVRKMHETVFLSREWVSMDLGLLTHREACEVFCRREPALSAAIKRTMENLPALFTPISETIGLLPIIKEKGHCMFYLSNIHKETRDFLIGEYEFFDLFDGGLFSCDVLEIKPSPEIYRRLLNKYALLPGDCLFFDDSTENVAAANSEGLNGILFTGAGCVQHCLSPARNSPGILQHININP